MEICCELCNGYYGIKRIDNIYVCNICDLLYPIKEEENEQNNKNRTKGR